MLTTSSSTAKRGPRVHPAHAAATFTAARASSLATTVVSAAIAATAVPSTTGTATFSPATLATATV